MSEFLRRVGSLPRILPTVVGPCLLTLVLGACSDGGGGSNTISSQALRDDVESRVGGLSLLMVPSDDADLPQPTLQDGTVDPKFAITDARRYLGKQIYFDPAVANRIRPEFGGDPMLVQTASCGSCHAGEAAGKAGQPLNLASGGRGRGFFDSNGLFHFDRRVVEGVVDTVPTGLDVFVGDTLVASGRFDAVDSVPRLAPSMIGFAFNNRLLLGGKAGQGPGEGPGADNPLGLSAGENLAEIAFDAHRILETGKDVLQAIPAYVALFREAFPEEAALADVSGDLDDLVNDHTAARAVAAFLRTVVTRDTPWDRFLAGDDTALTPSQRRGASLFFTPATEGGAGCIACHSGPMFNKQLGDEEGLLVEENFVNVGVGDHPLQALAREALQDPTHHDIGRGEITGDPADNFEFRTLTLRQLKDGRQFMHNALFKSVREVVEYFNAGVPADVNAVLAGNVDPRFTNPRGAGTPAGLGLTSAQIDDLVAFLEDGLYDPAFVVATPGSPTRAFELTAEETTYSQFRPDLAALGAVDAFTLGGKCPSNEDPVSRLDRGVDLIDVGDPMSLTLLSSRLEVGEQVDRWSLFNFGTNPIRTPLSIVVSGLPLGASLREMDGVTVTTPEPGVPYRRIILDSGYLLNGDSVEVTLEFDLAGGDAIDYDLVFLSGVRLP